MATYYSILTTIGKNKLAAAEISQVPLNIVEFAVGDSNGNYYEPVEGQVALVNEVWRGPCEPPYTHPVNKNWIVVEAEIPATVGGWDIREAAIFDDATPTANMIAVAKYPLSTKPLPGSGAEKDLRVRIIMEVSNAATVDQTIDPSLIYATKEYVDAHEWRKPVRVATTNNFGTQASLLVDSANANGDVTYTADTGGSGGNDITIAHVDPAAASQSLSVSVTGKDIVVNLATDGAGTVISTATDVANAVNADSSASPLINAVAEGTGTGIVAVAAAANLTNGLDVDGAAPNAIDGITLAANDRILVKDLDNKTRNGIYYVQDLGAGNDGTWLRATDADTAMEVTPNLMVTVEEGATNETSAWMLINDAPISIGTTELVFQFLFGKTGAAPGDYTKVTVDDFGRVTNGSNPTTLAGYGIADAYTDAETDTLLADKAGLGDANVFTATQTVQDSVGVVVDAAQPAYNLFESDAAADEKWWRVVSSGGALIFQTRTDAGAYAGANAVFLQVSRSGLDVADIDLMGTSLQFNGDNIFYDNGPGGALTTPLTVKSNYLNVSPETAVDVGLEVGQQVGGSSTASFLDFHTGSVVVDRDARILATGGDGSNDGGTINILSAALQHNGNDVALTTVGNTFTGINYFQHTSPQIRFTETDAASDEANWMYVASNGDVSLRAYDDAWSASDYAYTVTRTGYSVETFNVQATNLQHNGNDVLTTADEGAGNGLDADLLDGYNSSVSAAANTVPVRDSNADLTTRWLYFEGGDHSITTNDGAGNFNIRVGHQVDETYSDDGAGAIHMAFSHETTNPGLSIKIGEDPTGKLAGNPVTFAKTLAMKSDGTFTWDGSEIWHAGNHGAGKGLDADLLDGQHGSYYRNASNINAGTLPDARLSANVVTTVTTGGLNVKTIDIGDWNMDTSNAVALLHGLTLSKILMVSVLIRNNTDAIRTPLDRALGTIDVTPQGGVTTITSTHITVARATGGVFDSADYDMTSYNRGWITIFYVD